MRWSHCSKRNRLARGREAASARAWARCVGSRVGERPRIEATLAALRRLQSAARALASPSSSDAHRAAFPFTWDFHGCGIRSWILEAKMVRDVSAYAYLHAVAIENAPANALEYAIAYTYAPGCTYAFAFAYAYAPAYAYP